MKRKTAGLLCIVILIVSAFSSNVLAAFSDVDDNNQYKEAITTLSKLSVINGYEDGTFKPDGAITRAEFAKIIAYTLGYDSVESTEERFTDTTEHWAKNYINVCASFGIINGMGDGTFSPDSPVTYEQALKMVVCTLGYEKNAAALGGYPTGYQAQAATLGLTDGISGIGYSDGAPRGVIAQVIYNALDVDLQEEDNLGNASRTDKNLLNDYLKIYKIQGTLVGVDEYVTEDCTGTLPLTTMDVKETNGTENLIDYSTYTENVTDINQYLGKIITVYFKQDRSGTEKTLLIIDDETTKNTVVEINYDDIDSYEGSKLKYYVNDDTTKSLTLKYDDISIRYNGKLISKDGEVDYNGSTIAVKELFKEWLDPKSDNFIYGNVKITDNGANGDYNLVEIENYKTIVAYKAPTTSDYRIQDKLKNANYLILNPTSDDYKFTITKNGSQISTTQIAANDVVLYAESLDGELITAYVTSKTVSGSITSTSNNNEKLYIDGTMYDVRPTLESYVTDVEGKELKTGASGTFYLDKFDRIVFATISAEKALPYAYLYSASYEDGSDTGYVTVYNPSISASGTKTYKMNTKVKLNGNSKTSSQVVAELTASAANSNKDADEEFVESIYGKTKKPSFKSTSQLVKIKVEDSLVKEIITLSDTEGAQNDDSSKLVRYKDLTASGYYYTSNSFKENYSGSSLFTTNSNTTVLYIPMDRSQSSSYSKKTVSNAFTSGEYYHVEAYDVNDSKVAGLVVLYGVKGSMTDVSKKTDYSVVGSEPESYYNSETDDTTFKLSLYKGASNTATDWITYDDTEFADSKIGDVIQFAYDNDNLIQNRVNNIRYADISSVLSDTDADVLYDWTKENPDYNDVVNEDEELTDDEIARVNQKYIFDYRYKKTATSRGVTYYEDEEYTSSSLGTIPYSRAYMANVLQVLSDSKKLYVTKDGFTDDGNGNWTLSDSNYEEVTISSSTKIIRMNSNKKGFSNTVEGTETTLEYTDLKDAKNYGTNCSKILICTLTGTTKLIVIYE